MPTSPVFCALDLPDLDGAVSLAAHVRDEVGGFKVGLELLAAHGPDAVRCVVALGSPVFLDFKFHDIPNTVAGAVRAASRFQVAMLTVHAAGGRAMIRAAVDAASEAAVRPKILAVTVLTSLEDGDLAEIGFAQGVADQALRLADLAVRAGADGVVCSPHEVGAMRARFGPEVQLVVPGIRPAGSTDPDDQRRTLGPAEALAEGADVLVVGRPITAAADPVAAARAIAAELAATRPA
jgi:orotidine-5'-phosphate decarboxylase